MNPEKHPPYWASRLLRWLHPSQTLEEVEGDLAELYAYWCYHKGERKANALYVWAVLSVLPPFVRQRKPAYFYPPSSSLLFAMLRSYFTIACRNLSKHKLFTGLNVVGLALGMSLNLLFIALLAFLYRFDDFHPHKDRIYRVTTQLYDQHENPAYASVPLGIAGHLRRDITGVEKVVQIQRSLRGSAMYGEKKIWLSGYFADPAFLEVFNFPLLEGNKATALSHPNAIVFTEKEAKKIFGSKQAMGEVVSIEPYGDFVITGILKDLPENTHMKFGAIASYATYVSHVGVSTLDKEPDWKPFSDQFVYVLLNKDAHPGSIGQSLDAITQLRYAHQDVKASFKLQALNKIVPGPALYNPIGFTVSYLDLFLIGAITLLILIPACSNYVNLSISQSLERMKEIGVRKVLGGQKKHIFWQFTVESTVMVLLALLLSYPIYEILRSGILYQMVEIEPLDLSPTPATLIGFLLFALLVGFGAGIVPALYFAKISPIPALKGKEVKTSRRSYFRKIILTLQFMLSLGFIMAVVIMFRQYQYSVNYHMGFEQENILNIELQNTDWQIVKNEYGKMASVASISMSSHVMGIASAPEQYIKYIDQTDSIEAASLSVDEDFVPNLKLAVLAGSNFSERASENERLILVNEDFVRQLHLKEPFAALNKPFVLADGKEVRIGGVLKNFHFSGLKEPIKPLFFEYDPRKFSYANVKLASGDIAGSLTAMEALWKKIGGEGTFDAQLLADEIQEAFGYYVMIMKLWGFLGLLAITVACLGLLGTVSFTIKKRFKEISIRKVMGASTQSLVLLLSKDFILLLVIASIITIPVTYFMFDYLLATIQHYNIQIGFVEIVASVTIMLLLGLTTILSQTTKAANANPVDNLRNE